MRSLRAPTRATNTASLEYVRPLALQIPVARRPGQVIKLRIVGERLATVALNGPERQRVGRCRAERQRPFRRNGDRDALVEAAFAELAERHVCEREPGPDLHACVESADHLECAAIVA